MRISKEVVIVAGVAVLASVGVAGAAIGSDDDATDTQLTGAVLDNAAKAALAETGGGRVTETEIGDEESLYEVEVTLDDGSQVDVQLDENFAVVGTEGEDSTEDE